MTEAAKPPSGKARKRQAGNPESRPAASKVKATIHLSVEADQRLNVHCAMTRKDRSEMIEELINRHLRRYVVSDRGGAEQGAGGDDEPQG